MGRKVADRWRPGVLKPLGCTDVFLPTTQILGARLRGSTILRLSCHPVSPTARARIRSLCNLWSWHFGVDQLFIENLGKRAGDGEEGEEGGARPGLPK